MSRPIFSRVLLKLSGEALMGGLQFGTDPEQVQAIATAVRRVVETGVQLAIVPGGGNIYRGLRGAAEGMDRATGDYMGMLATVLNALTLQDACEKQGVHTRVQSAITVQEVAEPYIRRRAMRHLEKGRVVIFAAGTGNPYFTTDTTAALRAAEIEADIMFKGTHGGVDGVYTADPRTHPEAERLDKVTFGEVLAKELRVMDLTAITLCKENGMPVCVFDVMAPGNIRRALEGTPIGTLVTA